MRRDVGYAESGAAHQSHPVGGVQSYSYWPVPTANRSTHWAAHNSQPFKNETVPRVSKVNNHVRITQATRLPGEKTRDPPKCRACGAPLRIPADSGPPASFLNSAQGIMA